MRADGSSLDEMQRVLGSVGSPDFPVMTWPTHLIPDSAVRNSVAKIRATSGLLGLTDAELHALSNLNWYRNPSATRFDKAEIAALDLAYRALEGAIQLSLEWSLWGHPRDEYRVAAVRVLTKEAEKASCILDDVDNERESRGKASATRHRVPFVNGLAAAYLARPEECRGTQKAFIEDLERAGKYTPSKSNFSKAVRKVGASLDR